MSNYYEPQDIKNNKLLAVLSYISILVIIPIIVAPDSRFCRHHANQGLVLFIIGFAVNIINRVLRVIPLIGRLGLALTGLVQIALVILAICGIIEAIQGKTEKLPIIGDIQIIK